jgi:hypothetical protein
MVRRTSSFLHFLLLFLLFFHRKMAFKTVFGVLALLVAAASATPGVGVEELHARADPLPDNIVYVTDAQNFWSVSFHISQSH